MRVPHRSRYGPPGSLALAVSAAALAAICLALVPGPAAHAADPPRATAGFQTTDRLVLQVQLPDGKVDGAVRIDLLGPDGKILEEKTLRPGAESASLRVEFRRPRLPAGKLTVRTRAAGRAALVPLERILVNRAHETTLVASTDLFAGSETGMSIAVHGVKSLTESVPLTADVTVRLTGPDKKARVLHQGRTAADGVAALHFRVPELPAGNYTLEVHTQSALGEEKLTRQVRIQSLPKVLLTTDKPMYQPGQTIHIRALALRAFDLVPAGNRDLLIEVEDGKGNKVFKKEHKTSSHGIAQVDFTLADEVNMGDYRIRAVLGAHQSEKTVTVKKYVLPKFKVALTTAKTFYLPREKVEGTLQVDYFFGKPVAGGQVEVKASTFDVAFKEFATWNGKTDRNGHVTFDVQLPASFVGTPLAQGNAVVKLDVKVTDTAEHSETLVRTIPVSDQPIRVTLLPEGGRLIPGVENRIFAAATYPDGSPAACSVDVWLGKEMRGKPLASLKTNAAGLAELKLLPKNEQFRAGEWKMLDVEMLGGKQQRWGQTNLFDLTAQARDARGNKAQAAVALSSEPLGGNLLLRLDRAIYQGGDRLRVDVRSSAGMPTVYLDVVKSGQTMLTRWLDVKGGQASAHLDLPPHLFGTLEVHAYQVLSSGEVIRDARVVYVSPANQLKVEVVADRKEYLPGGKGTLSFQVTDHQGKPATAALGVIIVDEAVYALQEIQPGLEKVFFTLQQELLKPLAQAVYRPGESIDTLIRQPEVPAEKQQVAQALFTAVRPPAPPRWQVDPALARRQKAREQIQAIGQALFRLADTDTRALVIDRRTGQVRFAANVLERAVQARHLARTHLNDPLGGTLSAERLAQLEKDFTADRLAVRITQARLQHLFWPIVALGQNNQLTWLRGGKWTFPDDALERATKRSGLNTVDVWGRAMKLIRRPASSKNATGHTQFNDHVIASAGPDGKFGTADDILHEMLDPWYLSTAWWQDVRQQIDPNQFAWRFRLGEAGGMPPWGFFGGGFPAGPGGGPARPGMGGGFGAGGFGGATGFPGPGAGPKMAPAPGAPGTGLIGTAGAKGEGDAAAPAPLRLREYFPETLLWQPALITDARGRATLEVPFADSITTWRLTASASSQAGALGGTSAALRVFQDFFVDIDLPVALTQNDEVAFPVAVYNYLKEKQTVTLDLKADAWFDLIDGQGSRRQLTLAPGEVTAVKFRIRARKVGMQPLTVEARGSKMSDAIKRSVEIVPDGRAVEQVFNDRLKGTVRHTVTIPDNAIEGASKLLVKVYPGVVSQVMEGMEGMLRLPGG